MAQAGFINPFTAFKESYQAMEDVSTDITTKGALQKAYEGVKADSQGNKDLTSVYAQAAQLAAQGGATASAFEFGKQSDAYKKSNLSNQAAELKLSQERIGYAAQLAENANTPEDLLGALQASGVPMQEQMRIVGQLKQLPFPQQKEALLKIGRTYEQKLKADELVLTKQRTDAYMENIKHDNLLADQTAAQARIKFSIESGYEPSASDYAIAQGKKISPISGGGSTAEDASGQPLSVRNNNPLNIVDTKTGQIKKFDTPEEGAAAGKKDLEGKIAGTSEAYKKRFGDKPVTPERLAETWSPASAAGNSKESTDNYAQAIADAAGVKVGEPIPNTPAVKEKVFNAMAKFEAGPGSGAQTKEEGMKPLSLEQSYDKKRGQGLSTKEWATISPPQVQIGKEYQLNPQALTNATPDQKKQTTAAYEVTKAAERTAEYVKEHPRAVGTLAAVIKKAQGMSGDLLDNIAKDKSYTGEVAEMGKRLFALGLKDAGTGGRLNVYLEKQFANFYSQSQSPETLLRILKARQDESFDVLRDSYGADKSVLDKEKYPLASADSAKSYLGESSGTADKGKPSVPITSFFKNNAGGGASGFDAALQSLNKPSGQ